MTANHDATEMADLRRRADAGDIDLQAYLGLSFIALAVGQADFERGRAVLEKGASLGNGWCLYNLGVVYQQGSGVAADLARATEYWVRAAEAGNGPAAYNLSVQ